MKDYRVKITIRNDRLLSAIEGMGFDSVAKFCQKFNLEYQRTTEIINGKLKPINDKGVIKKTCDELLGILGLELHEAFTDRQLKGFKKRVFETKVEESELKQLISPVKNQEIKMIEKDVSLKLSDLFSKHLGPREEKVLRMRYGIGSNVIHTYEEISLELNTSRERARQIELRAIKKLQKRQCLRELASTGFYEVFEGIDTSLLKDDKLKEDVDFESKLEDVKATNRNIILSLYDKHLNYLVNRLEKYTDLPERYKNQFINAYKENFKKINKRSAAEKFYLEFRANLKNKGDYFSRLMQSLNVLEGLIDQNIEVDKNKKLFDIIKHLCIKLFSRRKAVLRMSRVDNDGFISGRMDNFGFFAPKETVVRKVYYK